MVLGPEEKGGTHLKPIEGCVDHEDAFVAACHDGVCRILKHPGLVLGSVIAGSDVVAVSFPLLENLLMDPQGPLCNQGVSPLLSR